MAPLTWRNVAAPSFAPAIEGVRTAGALLNDAVRNASSGIAMVQNQNQQAADRAVMERALAIQDPEAYNQALRSGSVTGPDTGRASLATLQGLDNRASTLLQRAGDAERLRQTQYQNQRGRAADARLDMANPDFQQALVLARNNDQEGLNNLVANSESLRNLSPEQFSALLSQSDQLSSNQQGRIQTGQSIRGTEYDYNRGVQSDNDADASAQALVDTVRVSGTNADATVAAEQILPRLSGQAGAQYLQQLSGAGYQPYAPIGSGGGGGNNPGTRQGNVFDTTFNFTPTQAPITSMPIREVMGVQQGLLDQHGASPVGAFQINRGTLQDYAPRVLGANWQDQPLSAENQDKIAQAIFEDRKNGDLTGTWAALDDKRPGAYADVPWSEMRNRVAQAETGNTLPTPDEIAQANQDSSLAQRLIAERVSQNTATGITGQYDSLLNDRSTVTQAAGSLRNGEDAPLSGTSQDFLEDQIRWVQQQSDGRLNPSQAAAIIADSAVQQPDGFFSGLGRDIAQGVRAVNPWSDNNRNTPNLGNNRMLDNDRLQSTIDRYLSGDLSRDAAANNSTRQISSLVQSAQSAYNQAVQEFQAIAAAARTRPALANSPSYRNAQAKVESAQQNLQQLLSQLPQDDSILPRFNRTQPEG